MGLKRKFEVAFARPIFAQRIAETHYFRRSIEDLKADLLTWNEMLPHLICHTNLHCNQSNVTQFVILDFCQ